MEISPAKTVDNQNQLLASLISRFSARWPSLVDKPEESPESAIRALWFAAANRNRSVQKAAEGELPVLNAPEQNRLDQLLEQRLSGVPLAHLIGWQQFMGLEFKASPQALIPRQETEILGNAALKCLREVVSRNGQANVIDMCTGSGNLAIALATHEPACRVFAADLCVDAIALAKENAKVHLLEERVDFRVGDLFAPFQGELEGMADLVVCNPPYLSTAKVRQLPREIGEFEPREAFDAGSFGLGIISRLISEAPRYLKPKSSWLCFEVGLGQGDFFASRLERTGTYQNVQTVKDNAGEVRALIANL